ncbi:MAG: chemotaxis protein CheW [Candidatus Thiodiazotropha sp.]
MSEKPRLRQPQTLEQPDNALANYLDSLLAEIDTQRVAPSPPQAVKEATPQADTLLEERLSRDAARSVAEQTRMVEANGETSLAPPWAETPFQLLRFSLRGVNLVVPLRSLTGIMPLEGAVNHLPGQPPWSLGVAMNHATKVVVVDTRRLLMPTAADEEPGHSHLLLIGEGDLGLAVDGISGTMEIDKEAIRWRGGAAQHPWYGGILVEELSVLLDVDGVIEMLRR